MEAVVESTNSVHLPGVNLEVPEADGVHEDLLRFVDFEFLHEVHQRDARSLRDEAPAPEATQQGFTGKLLSESQIAQVADQLFRPDAVNCPRIVGFSGIEPGTGTTTILANLALQAQSQDERVLFADLNLNHPQLPSVFALPGEPGILEVISQGARLRESIRHLEEGRVGILPLGMARSHAPLQWRSLAEVIRRVAKYYDFTMLDLPPLERLLKDNALEGLCEGIVLVSGASDRSHARARKLGERVVKTGTRTIGIIINRQPSELEATGDV